MTSQDLSRNFLSALTTCLLFPYDDHSKASMAQAREREASRVVLEVATLSGLPAVLGAKIAEEL